jgi:hypothetical protein
MMLFQGSDRQRALAAFLAISDRFLAVMPSARAFPPMRPSAGILAALGRGCFLNLTSSNPADHDGGSDRVGGAFLAFRASWHHRPSFSLRPNIPPPTAAYRNPAYIYLPRTLSAEPEWWCRFRNRPAHIHLRYETAQRA